MKRIRCFALAAVLLMTMFPATGCGFAKEDGSTLELDMSHSWRSERTLTNSNYDPWFVVGTHILCSKDLPNTGTEYCWYDLETQTKTRFFPQCNEELQPLERLKSDPIRLPDGTFGIICMIYQGLGGGEIEIHRRCMEVYDADLNLLETRELPHLICGDEYFTPERTCVDKDGNWYVMRYDSELREVIHCYQYKPGENGGEFLEYGVAEPPSDMFNYMFTAADGTVYASYLQFDESHHAYEKLYKLDAVNHAAEPADLAVGDGVYGCMTGTMGYDFYYSTGYGLYGVKDEETTQLVNWLNSDFVPYRISECMPVDDGTFVVRADEVYWHITPRSQEEIDNTNLISLAAVDLSGALLEAVIDYNRAENGNRIVVKDYGEYDTPDDPHKGYEIMKKDMLDGAVADMICADGQNFESLASKGLFADWYDLMDADPEFRREDYLENFFEAYEYKGKLHRLGVGFWIMTSVAKTEYAGEEQGLSLGAQFALPLEEGMERFLYDRLDDPVEEWITKSQTALINRETAECTFDSPEFVTLLAHLDSLPENADNSAVQNNGDFAPSDYAANWREDRVLFFPFMLDSAIALRSIRRYYFSDADMTLTGYPMAEGIETGNGGVFDTAFTVSVNAQSTEKDRIWDFMKHLLSEEYQKEMSFPIHKDALEYKIEEAEGMITATAFGEMNIGALEEWESDILRDYIGGIRTCYDFDYRVHDILMEETEKMLAGDQTPQEAAEMMQSRVTIYLSEQS